jgi:hypothetical protein
MEAAPRKNYPRAIPLRSPEEIAAQTQRLRDEMAQLATQSAQQRRWNYALSTALALVVVLGIAVALYLKSPGPGTSVASPAAELATPHADAALKGPSTSQPAANEPPAKDPTANEPSRPPAQEAQSPGPSARVKPAADLPQAAQYGVMLESLGGLSAANLYQSYLNIGLLADGVESEAFTIEGGASTLKIIANCLTLVDKKLAKLDKESLDPEDQGSLERIKAVAELLRIQARVLLAYWLTGGPVQSAQYQFARRASWKGLSQVLGLDAE